MLRLLTCPDLAENLIAEGGLYINFERVVSREEVIRPEHHVLAGGMTVIRVGEESI